MAENSGWCCTGYLESDKLRINTYLVSPLKKIVVRILRLLRIADIIEVKQKGFLKETGWFRSYYSGTSIDKNGEPIPWCTYSYNKFIEERLNSDLAIFEFGCGNSTLWYSTRVKKVDAVEHDLGWYKNLKTLAPSNVNILHKELTYGGSYSKACSEFQDKYDVIIVDGRDRVNCVKNAVEFLSEGGVIVLDNSERVQYKPGVDYLSDRGFKQLEFYGNVPAKVAEGYTSIFYREKNVLNI